jgi:hypothetical protein
MLSFITSVITTVFAAILCAVKASILLPFFESYSATVDEAKFCSYSPTKSATSI